VDAVTLALAIVGALLGIFNTALAWWQWQHSGPRVKVALRGGWYMPGGGIASYGAADYQANPRPNGARAVALVAVTNRGRSAVDVTEWWITVGSAYVGMLARLDPNLMSNLGPELFAKVAPTLMEDLDGVLMREHNEPCPYRLESHASKAWVLPMEKVTEIVDAIRHGGDCTISAVVHLGNGQIVKAKERVAPESFVVR
jgi:hypothetical protein